MRHVANPDSDTWRHQPLVLTRAAFGPTMSLLENPRLIDPPPSLAARDVLTPVRPSARHGVARKVASVTLVGAGPGDPDLLTIKALRALQQARFVMYDHLVSKEVLRLVPHDAELMYVGKESSQHTLSQTAIIELMIRLARNGTAVLRLKGGDGYIFGRGGEEAQALADAGIPCDVIPGLTAAQGAAASFGIPLTHRDHAQSVVFATAHLRSNRELDLDWQRLACPQQTVVFYMGVGTLPTLCEQLIAHGRSPTTPAAILERVTLPDQRCITGTLADLPALAQQARIAPPALIIVGEVVSLHAQIGPLRQQAIRDARLSTLAT